MSDNEKEFTGIVLPEDAEQYGIRPFTYTRSEMADHIGVVTLTDKQAQETACAFTYNVEGEGRWDFNDCEEDMIEDLRQEFTS